MTPGQRAEYLGELFSATYLNHEYMGFFARVVAACAVLSFVFVMCWRSFQWNQETVPLAQRWFGGWHEITFLERIEQPGTNVVVYRFALPHTYDSLGHKAITSVLLRRDLDATGPWCCHRWYTPISHPDQRGVVEFAIKTHRAGVFTAGTMITLEPGQKLLMGCFKNEFEYKANEFEEVGFIAGNSGITPFLQMLTVALADSEDKTKFSLLYTNRSPTSIPFRRRLEQLAQQFPNRVKVTFICQSDIQGKEEIPLPIATKRMREEGFGIPISSVQLPNPKAGQVVRRNQRNPGAPLMSYDDQHSAHETAVGSTDPAFQGFAQTVDRNLILETMPAPGQKNTKVFVCLNERHLAGIAGRTQNMWTYGLSLPYWQGNAGGIMGSMGYTRSQLHKFGYSSVSSWMNKDTIVMDA